MLIKENGINKTNVNQRKWLKQKYYTIQIRLLLPGVCSISHILTVLHRAGANFTIVAYGNINLCARKLAQNS